MLVMIQGYGPEQQSQKTYLLAYYLAALTSETWLVVHLTTSIIFCMFIYRKYILCLSVSGVKKTL